MTSKQAGLILQHIRRLAGRRPTAQLPDAQLLERFTTQHDEAAFEALVRRHGPTVLNVCRSVLHHEQDAEDAFQATFLVLLRKAESIRRPEALAGWLYEVAYHVAVKAQANAARRRVQERKVAPMASPDPSLDMTLRDLRRVLHEELRRLPEKYRLPLVLCYLEGRSQEEAAGQLGWSKSTLRGRLDRGREHLRRRLAARGVALSALLSATAIGSKAGAEALVDAVVRGAVRAAVDGAAAGVVSARVAALAAGAARAMIIGKLKTATAVLLALGLVASGGALARHKLASRELPARGQQPETRNQRAEPAAAEEAAKPQTKDSIIYSGRVLGPDGQAVAGANLYLAPGWSDDDSGPLDSDRVHATTGPDGRFQFTLQKMKFGNYQMTTLVATAPGHGTAWLGVDPHDKKENLTLGLVKDDVPVVGQVVDLEGRPIEGVSIQLLMIKAATRGDPGAWYEAAKDRQRPSGGLEYEYFSRGLMGRRVPDLPQKTVSNAEGRFRLTGFGRDRLITVRISGATVAVQDLHILTRPGESMQVTEFLRDDKPVSFTTYYGASFRHVAAPTKPITGVVRDNDTKKPLAGITIQSYKLCNSPFVDRRIAHTTTDAQGRYRLTGLPKGEGNEIAIVATRDLPYISVHVEVPDSLGLDPVSVDVQLKRGVWIQGQITDKITGKPLRGLVEYFSMLSNPHLQDYPGFDGTILPEDLTVRAKEDGSYRIIGLPGPGVVAVYGTNDYLSAAEREGKYGINGPSLWGTSPYHITFTSHYGALARINPTKGADSVRCDATLDPGWSYKVTVVGPDGKPLPGAQCSHLNGRNSWEHEPMKTAEGTGHFDPRRACDLIFQHREKGLVGIAQPPKEDGGSITVRLESGAAITGRLVDVDGKPRAGVGLEVSFRPR